MSNTNSNQTIFRSLDELEDTPEFQQFLKREFPEGAEEAPSGVSRRRWLQLMGASAVLAGVSGCRFENKEIAPYAFRPEGRVPGATRTFATTVEWAGNVRPLYVTSYDSRPIKVDGNPQHPQSGGSGGSFASGRSGRRGGGPVAEKGTSDMISQACVLDLYDPDRPRGCLEKVDRNYEPRIWGDFVAAVKSMDLAASAGEGLVVLAEPSTSQAIASLKQALAEKYAKAKWFEYSPVNSDNESAGLKLAFGKPVRPVFDISRAEVVVCLDADPLQNHPSMLKLAKDWASSRVPSEARMQSRPVPRLYAIESQFSLTGVNADHRWPMKSGHIASFAQHLRNQIEKVREANAPLAVGGSLEEQRVAILANELVYGINPHTNSSGGKCVVLAGENQPPEVHQIVAAINDAIGSEMVRYIDAPEPAGSLEQIGEAVELLNSGSVKQLLVIGGNPVYDAPSDLGFEAALGKAGTTIHLSVMSNETTFDCDWYVNMSHPFEAWGDSVAYDGSRCLSQPLIEPLFDAHSAVEVLALLVGDQRTGQEIVRESFGDLDDSDWYAVIHDGFQKGSAPSPEKMEVKQQAAGVDPSSWLEEDDSVELVFTSSPMFDGRLANNGWLQEVPDSVTKVTWDNPAILSPATAQKLGARQNEKIKIEVDGQTVEAPVFIQPGQADGSIGIAIGYGRKKVGYIGGSIDKGVDPVGVSISPIRRSSDWNIVSDIKANGTGSRMRLASTQDHHAIDLTGKSEIGSRWNRLIYEGTAQSYDKFADRVIGREEENVEKENNKPLSDFLAVEEDIAESEEKPKWPGHHHLHFENVDPIPRGWDYSDEFKWGMSIDLNRCTGCSACVVACQAENNIGIVGKDEVARGRELHWLRIDRYMAANDTYASKQRILDDPEPRIRTQPVACHHCENAPCEQVCPVAATVHSDEGLNDMVYNRCIGTRYCGNNCPYKVRRFNYLNYSDATTFVKYPWADKLSQDEIAVRQLVNNPEVTIRSRGVMEKCTYCVQRIQNAKIKAKAEDRRLGPDEITTACQDCCPTNAIMFGNLGDVTSKVSENHGNVRSYIMLEELNIGQRTKYLARVTHPNMEWPVPVLDDSGNESFLPYGEVFKEPEHHGAHGEHHGEEHHDDEHHDDKKHDDEKHDDGKSHSDEKSAEPAGKSSKKANH